MSTAWSKKLVTPEEYLAAEDLAEFKSEYYDGEVFAMSGGSLHHAMISANVIVSLGNHLQGGRCRVLSGDMRVMVEPDGLYTYPDACIVCGTPKLASHSSTTLTNPTVIVEVLSPSTVVYDRTIKFWRYEKLASLRDYLLVAQDHPFVQHYEREPLESRPPGQWLYRAYEGLDAVVRLASVAIEVPLREIYSGVEIDRRG